MNPESYDKMGLDIRCSKHLFSIMTEDHLHKRKMDWIYRNVKGAKVTRRTHQVLEVPPLPEQITPPPGSSRPDMFITEAGGLTVDEREGGVPGPHRRRGQEPPLHRVAPQRSPGVPGRHAGRCTTSRTRTSRPL